MPRRILARPVAEILVERAQRAQRFQQDFLILLRHRIVEPALFRRLGEEFRHAAVVIGLDVADALRLAAERVGGMQPGVVIELDEGLERNPETAAIVEDRIVVIGDAPRPRIEIEAGVEFACLRRAAELGEHVAAADRPVPSAGSGIVFEHAHLIAGALELDRRRHASKAGSKNDDRGALRIAIEPDRATVGRFRRIAKAGHRLVGRRGADARADDLEQSSPAQSRRGGVAHRSVVFHLGGIVASSQCVAQSGESQAPCERPSNPARISASGRAWASTRSAAAAMSSIEARGKRADGSAASLISATMFGSSG